MSGLGKLGMNNLYFIFTPGRSFAQQHIYMHIHIGIAHEALSTARDTEVKELINIIFNANSNQQLRSNLELQGADFMSFSAQTGDKARN